MAGPRCSSTGVAARGRYTASTATVSPTCSTSARCETPQALRPIRRTDRARRADVDSHHPRDRAGSAQVPGRVHSGLLQQRGQAACAQPGLWRWCCRFPRSAAALARARWHGRRAGRVIIAGPPEAPCSRQAERGGDEAVGTPSWLPIRAIGRRDALASFALPDGERMILLGVSCPRSMSCGTGSARRCSP